MTNPEHIMAEAAEPAIDLEQLVEVRQHRTTCQLLFLSGVDVRNIDFGEDHQVTYDNDGEAYLQPFEIAARPRLHSRRRPKFCSGIFY